MLKTCSRKFKIVKFTCINWKVFSEVVRWIEASDESHEAIGLIFDRYKGRLSQHFVHLSVEPATDLCVGQDFLASY